GILNSDKRETGELVATCHSAESFYLDEARSPGY
ncbi:unnamed protein product, partial [Oikopleura dioica]